MAITLGINFFTLTVVFLALQTFSSTQCSHLSAQWINEEFPCPDSWIFCQNCKKIPIRQMLNFLLGKISALSGKNCLELTFAKHSFWLNCLSGEDNGTLTVLVKIYQKNIKEVAAKNHCRQYCCFALCNSTLLKNVFRHGQTFLYLKWTLKVCSIKTCKNVCANIGKD